MEMSGVPLAATSADKRAAAEAAFARLRNYVGITADLIERWRRQVERGERDFSITLDHGVPTISTTFMPRADPDE